MAGSASIEQMMEHHLGRMKEHVKCAAQCGKSGDTEGVIRHNHQARLHHGVIESFHHAISQHHHAEKMHAMAGQIREIDSRLK